MFELSQIEKVPGIREKIKAQFGFDPDFEGGKHYLEANDSAGNTFKATAKPVLIGTAVVGATTMIFSIILLLGKEGLLHISLTDAPVLLGFICGGTVIFWFSGASMQAVTTGAYRAVEFIKKNLDLNKTEADIEDSKTVVRICTQYAQSGMWNIFIALMTITLAFAFFDPNFFVAYLISIAVFGLFQAISMANAGGAWDNAKKYVEVDLREKGTALHAATVVGDTVGDPFKDTTSVALNPIIKFSTLFGLLAVEIAVEMKEAAHTNGTLDYTACVGVAMLAVALGLRVAIVLRDADSRREIGPLSQCRESRQSSRRTSSACCYCFRRGCWADSALPIRGQMAYIWAGQPLTAVRRRGLLARCTRCRSFWSSWPAWRSPIASTARSWRPRWRRSTIARVTPAHTLNDGQNYHPTHKWVLFGHHFAAISGAGPLIGPVLAIQFGYMPGLVWIVVGVCLAGAVQDMLVLAASVRRGGRSLAEIARAEIGSLAGGTASIAILFVVIIALSGLGVVVVKALGGEEIKLAAGTVFHLPDGGEAQTVERRRAATMPRCRRARGIAYTNGAERGAQRSRSRSHGARRPTQRSDDRSPLEPADGRAITLPEGVTQAVPGSSWGTFTIACTVPIALVVGLYMYKIRKGRVVEASAHRRGRGAGRHGGRQLDSRLGARAVLSALAKPDDPGDLRLRLHRLGAAGVAAAVPARLPVELSEDRHGGPAGRRGDRGQSRAEGPDGQRAFCGGRRAVFQRRDFSVLLHLHHVRRDLGVSRAGLVGHDAQDDRQGKRHPHDRLRRDADRGPGRRHGPDRRRLAAAGRLLGHQHRPVESREIRRHARRKWAPPPTTWPRSNSRSAANRCAAAPAAR